MDLDPAVLKAAHDVAAIDAELIGLEEPARKKAAEAAKKAAEKAAFAKLFGGPKPKPGAQPATAARKPPTPVDPAVAAKKKVREQKNKIWENAKIDWELRRLQRDVTLGRWERVATYLRANFTDKDRPKAYDHLVKGLRLPPPRPGTRLPPNLREGNSLSFDDIWAIAAATPRPLNAAGIAKLTPLVKRALDMGHAAEAMLAKLTAEAKLAPGKRTFTRRQAALLLASLKRDADLGKFLPDEKQASANDDREALNLLSRHYLALYAKDKKTKHLERAWTVTQSALAVGSIGEKDKAEALRRAVELAPKIRKDLGATWLADSFSSRPERGMEILATIGGQAASGFRTHGRDKKFRHQGLELQKTAVDALLTKAPQLASKWRETLNLLGANWLVEALHCYGNSNATSLGPRMQRDYYGNWYYYNHNTRYGGQVTPLEPGDVLKVRPSDTWIAAIEPSVRPRFAMIVAQLYLKVGEGKKAFPHIAALAKTHPKQGKELAEEFLRVWARNNNPNVNSSRTNPYMFIYGFEQRANAIPLTRSKQERNLRELGEWVAKINDLPIEPVDQKLVVSAFTAAHSTAEVFKPAAFARVFGSLAKLDAKTMAQLVQKMRSNLGGIWRQPAEQKKKKTNRRQKDIEREVTAGYAIAQGVVDMALQHEDHWALHVAKAALAHDHNNYRQELGNDSDFSSRRKAAMAALASAAESYGKGATDRPIDDETIEPYETWFYATLGACDLRFVSEGNQPDRDQTKLIKAAMDALPDTIRERHYVKFCNTLFTRLSAVNPACKFRYLRAAFEIVGDHPHASEARKVYAYYGDLVTEVKLDAVIDGHDLVGQKPFGVHINLRHTKEIERESGGFKKYLQNQNNTPYFSYNYGRPTENYRDKFQETATKALKEHFEVLSVTFNAADVNSKATENAGWRVTPYAYILLKARGPEVDKIPPVQIDLDFLDTTGYAVLPVVTPAVPIDASKDPDERPYEKLEITQMLDERRAEEGKLVLEVKAKAVGLIPDLDSVVDLGPTEFDISNVEDQGVSVSSFDDAQRRVVSERTWMVSLTAKEGLAARPTTFEFAATRIDDAKMVYQRYADADLITSQRVANLKEQYGEPGFPWMWVTIPLLVIGIVVTFLVISRGRPDSSPDAASLRLPSDITPFSVLGLLRDIEQNNGFTDERRSELGTAITEVEQHYFGETGDAAPDLRGIAEHWVRRAR